MYHARYKDDVISFILLTTEGGDTSRIITVTLQLTGKSRLTVRLILISTLFFVGYFLLVSTESVCDCKILSWFIVDIKIIFL